MAGMNHFMIRYRLTNATQEAWHREMAAFVSALDGDPELKGRISYRCMKIRDDDSYFHLAAAADEQAIKTLQGREYFKRYTEKTKEIAGGEVTVSPLEILAETGHW